MQTMKRAAAAAAGSTASSARKRSKTTPGGGGGGGGAAGASAKQRVAKAPALLLAHCYDEARHADSVVGWHMSEKLDGVRAYWDGHGALVSRLGNVFAAPVWFTDALPQGVPLDGELYIGRGRFAETISAVRRQTPDDAQWRRVRYHVFDAPHDTHTFEQRMATVRRHSRGCSVVHVVEHVACRGSAHVRERLDAVVRERGEGVMLREPNSKYERKRSHTLLKVKKAYDAEARVVTHEQGKGRNAARLGALRCEMASGKRFKLGSGLSDAERDAPPPVGAIVTYSFNEITANGVPRFPRFVRVRDDVLGPRDVVP